MTSRKDCSLVLRHERTCSWMRWEILRTGEQKDRAVFNVSSPCLDDHHFKEELESVGELSTVCSQIVLKCLYLARNGFPNILWSVNKLCSISHRMDTSLWQTFSKIDFAHLSHKWPHGSALSIGFIPRLRFCWRPSGLKIHHGEEYYVHLEVGQLSPSVGCARKERQYPTDPQNQASFRCMLGCEGWITCSWFMGCGDRSVTFIEENQNTNQPSSRKLFVEWQNPNPAQKKRKTRLLINCRMRNTSPQTQILLKVSLSCTSLRTTEPWSKC